MRYILSLLFTFVFFSFVSPVYAQQAVTPTIYCVGGVGAPPCAPFESNSTVLPTQRAGAATTPASGGNNNPNPVTTTAVNNPRPVAEPCSDTNSVMTGKDRKKSGGGFIARFFRFIMWLIQFIINGGNVPIPTDPNPSNPNPTSQPTDPDVSPPTSPDPTTEPENPCPEPTNGTEPSTNPEPTTGTGGGGTTTPSTQPSSGPSVAPGSMPAITVSGNKIQRGGQDWWFVGYNSFVWSGDCGNDEEKMSPADVEAWFASMRHDGHGAVRLFFYDGWDMGAMDAAIASAKKHNIYLILTLDDAIGGCGENDKDDSWFDNASERATFKSHMENMLTKYKGETAIFALEFFNEPSYAGGKLRSFYDEMGAAADAIDPDRLFSSGTVAPYWLDGEENFKDVSSSPGVDIVSLHEYDEGEIESNHGPRVIANAAGKPVIAGEFGISANEAGSGCISFTERADRFTQKAQVYTGNGYVGGFAWAWQPGNGGGSCEYGNIDADSPTQEAFRTLTK